MANSVVVRQTKLLEFFPYIVRHRYIPITRSYVRNRGLSERLVRNMLEKTHWTVWRGGSVGIEKEHDAWPNVRNKYELLRALLEEHYPEYADEIEFMCKVHHGMPDFICYRRGHFKFVECKLGHEQLSQRQKHCITKLQRMGFHVEVHKLVFNCTKIRYAEVNLETGKKKILEKQMRLKLHWKRS